MRHAAPKRLWLKRIWPALAVVLLLFAGAAWYARRHVSHWRVDRWMSLIEKNAAERGVDPDFAAAVVEMESGGDPRARSEADARGLMQVTAITLEEVRDRRKAVGPGDLWDPAYNLSVGCAYLAQLNGRFQGDPSLVLAAYHMGPSRVAKWLSAHPGAGGAALVADTKATGPKTRAYVEAVLALWEDRKRERAEQAPPEAPGGTTSRPPVP